MNEKEIISILDELSAFISKDLGVKKVEVEFKEISEDAKIDVDNEKIIINKKFITDYTECVKCVIFEYRKIFQLYYIKDHDDELSQIFKNAMKEENTTEINELDIDAYAYVKEAFKHYFKKELVYENKEYNQLIEGYRQKYFYVNKKQ